MKRFNFNPFPEIASQRFRLRQLRAADAKEIFALRSDERVNKYIDRIPPKKLSEASAFIEKINKGIKSSESIYWGICPISEETLIGTICLWNLSEVKSRGEIGFELQPDQHGKGLMKELMPLVIDYGFHVMKLVAIEGFTHQENLRSIRLMEHFGFVRDFDAEKKLDRNGPDITTVIFKLDNPLIEKTSV